MVQLMARRRRQRPSHGDARRARRGDANRAIADLRGNAVGAEREPGPDGDAAPRRGPRRGDARQGVDARVRVPLDACSGHRRRSSCCRYSKPSPERRKASISTCAYQPEFLREGSSIRDYDRPPFTIVGASRSAPADALRALFGHLPCEFHVTSIRAAEMLKYSCNNFHALKITFANETARVCEAMGIDPFEVMDLVCQDRQLNISPAYLKPGFAFGGSCLPKDLRATMHFAKTRDVDLPMHGAIAASNRIHIDHAIAKVMATGRRRIGMIGLSFKTGTDDLRESPLVQLAEHFHGKGLELLVYDPDVHLSNLLGANRRFIEQHVPHLGMLMRSELDAVVAQSDVLVVGSNDQKTVQGIWRHARSGQTVIDLIGLPKREGLRADLVGLCW